jgi:hypothetical protein
MMLASIAEREQSRDLFTGRKDSKINPFFQTSGLKKPQKLWRFQK